MGLIDYRDEIDDKPRGRRLVKQVPAINECLRFVAASGVAKASRYRMPSAGNRGHGLQHRTVGPRNLGCGCGTLLGLGR